MNNNWIIFAAILFFIFRLFTTAAKKQAALAKKNEGDALQKAIADQARKHHATESVDKVRVAAEVLRARADARERLRAIKPGAEDFELAYKSDEYKDVGDTPTPGEFVNRFGSSADVIGGTYMETPEERAVYDIVAEPRPRLLPAMNTSAYREYIITREIFDKPKAMRR